MNKVFGALALLRTVSAACATANVEATYASGGFYDNVMNVYIWDPVSLRETFDLNGIFSYSETCASAY